MLKGKTIVLGVTGSIAAYKIANLASMLVKLHGDVHVIMTENATKFIHPITFETLTGNKCLVETFDRNFQFHVAHVSLGQKADVMLIAPATANIIAKIANGIADDMLSTTVLATTAPIIISPAMNTKMYENKIVQDNIEKCKTYGMEVIQPAFGFLACRDIGAGKMPDPEVLLSYILRTIAYTKDFAGKKILVTAGPTCEPLDPVRYLTNHSTGKMGYALAEAAMLRGGEVTLISGPVQLNPVPFVKVIQVQTAQEMYQAVMDNEQQSDVIVMSAAVADYRPTEYATEKIKKQKMETVISLEPTTDILAYLGKIKTKNQFLCGFSMETESMLNFSREKRIKKNADMMIANNLKEEGAGFGTDTNIVTIITENNEEQLKMMTKKEVAHLILDRIKEKSKR